MLLENSNEQKDVVALVASIEGILQKQHLANGIAIIKKNAKKKDFPLSYYYDSKRNYRCSSQEEAEVIAKVGRSPIRYMGNIYFMVEKSKWEECIIVIQGVDGARGEEILDKTTQVRALATLAIKTVELLNKDTLTGLYNRSFLERFSVENPQEKLKASGKKYVIFGIDLNAFKEINDTYGHAAWDRVLQVVAETLQKSFGRSIDFVCRNGGDEFTIIIDSTDWEEAQLMNKNIEIFKSRLSTRMRAIDPESWLPEEKKGKWIDTKLSLTVWVGFMDAEYSLEAAQAQADADMLKHKPELGTVLRIIGNIINLKEAENVILVVRALENTLQNFEGISESTKDEINIALEKAKFWKLPAAETIDFAQARAI